jgi:hypothetical protein
MNQLELEKMSADELIERLVQVGVAQDEAQLEDNHSGFNRLYDQMREVDRELRARGQAARMLLLRLFDHPNIQVRLNAAALSLAVAPTEARRALEAIARSNQGC